MVYSRLTPPPGAATVYRETMQAGDSCETAVVWRMVMVCDIALLKADHRQQGPVRRKHESLANAKVSAR